MTVAWYSVSPKGGGVRNAERAAPERLEGGSGTAEEGTRPPLGRRVRRAVDSLGGCEQQEDRREGQRETDRDEDQGGNEPIAE
jgi:hypothetical protein